MSYYAGPSFLGPQYGWQQEDVNKIDENYLNYLRGKLNDVSKSTKNNGRALLEQYMAQLDDANGETQTPQDWENLKKLHSFYASTKDGRGTTFESFQARWGQNFGTWKNAGSAESQGHVAAYGGETPNGMLSTGQEQNAQGQTQAQNQYPAMANDYGLGSQQNTQMSQSQPVMYGQGQQGMTPQPGGQAVQPQAPLTQQAGSESSRGFNPWSLIGESIARSR